MIIELSLIEIEILLKRYGWIKGSDKVINFRRVQGKVYNNIVFYVEKGGVYDKK